MFDYESKRYKFHINEIKMNKIHNQTNENEKLWKRIVIFLKNTRSNSGKEEYKSLNNTTFERTLCWNSVSKQILQG